MVETVKVTEHPETLVSLPYDRVGGRGLVVVNTFRGGGLAILITREGCNGMIAPLSSSQAMMLRDALAEWIEGLN